MAYKRKFIDIRTGETVERWWQYRQKVANHLVHVELWHWELLRRVYQAEHDNDPLAKEKAIRELAIHTGKEVKA